MSNNSSKTDVFQFPIPNDVLEPYIRSAVSTAIVAALGDGTKLVENAVAETLKRKVDDRGKVSQYSSDNKFTYAEVVCKDVLGDVIKQTLSEMAEQMKPDLKKEITKQLKASSSKIAASFVDRLAGNLDCEFKVDLHFGR